MLVATQVHRIVAYEDSDRYIQAALVTVIAVPVLVLVMALPGTAGWRLSERWAAGHEVDRAQALNAGYAWARAAVGRVVVGNAVWAALLLVIVGAMAGATGSRLFQYGILGVVFGILVQSVAIHGFVEAVLRPVRVAIASDSDIGDSMPRSRPTFASWSNLSMVSVACVFAIAGAIVASVVDWARELPVVSVVIGCALTIGFAVPITVGAAFSRSLQPIRDLAAATERVAAGDYSRRLPVVQDDDLGALAASYAGGFG